MLKLLLPKEASFFVYFRELAALIVEAALEFQRLLAAPRSERATHCQKIKQLEHSADEVTHKTMTRLHATFITPLEREDIHQLVKRLDDIIDFLDAAAQRIELYDVGDIPEPMVKMAAINSASAEKVKGAMAMLSDLGKANGLLDACVDINRLENEADAILRSAVAGLFKHEVDVRQLIKLKEIYELLETVSDRCEDVANVIESIVIEHS